MNIAFNIGEIMNDVITDKDVESLSRSLGEVCFSRAFNSCGRLISKYYTRLMKEAGMKSQQFDLMMLLVKYKDEEISAAEMSNVLGMDRTTMKRNCDTMSRNGLIEMPEKSRFDKRCWGKVKVTAKGMNQLKKAIPGWKKANAMAGKLIGNKIKEMNSISMKMKDCMPNV